MVIVANRNNVIFLEQIKNYIHMVESYPSLFRNLWPETVEHLVDLPLHFVSPIREQHGRRVLVLSLGNTLLLLSVASLCFVQ